MTVDIEPQQALAGLRVLDFSRVLAGPFCTMMLADMGADVVKVEHPQLGDETRHWGPPWAGSSDDKLSAYYLSINRNKSSIALDLKTPEGQATARELALKADVLIENFKVGQMAQFGLDYESLAQDNPRLVYCSLTGYGQTGVYAPRPGYDYVIQAQTGLMSITGPSDGEPHKVGVAISDVVAGLNAASAIQSALLYRERTGQGQYLDVALFDTQLAALVNITSNYLVSGAVPPRLGNLHPNIVPYQVFPAQDGEFVLAVGNDRQFATFCQIIAKPEWVEDERFATNGARVENRDLLASLLSAILRTQPVEYWIEQCLAHKIPCGKINTVAEALHLDHTQAREMVQTVTLSNGETVQIVAPAVKFSATPATIRTPPPQLGQHTAEVLQRWLNPAGKRATVIKDHQRSYDDPLILNARESVQITKQDMWDDQYLWLWCISPSGKEGWTPASFLDVQGETGVVSRDYNALELTVQVGEALQIHEEESGWYWVENQAGEQGWVPISCCEILA